MTFTVRGNQVALASLLKSRLAVHAVLTCLRTHLVQQLHHALSLHGGPVFDGRAPSDLAVLLLDLRRAALRDERAEPTAENKDTPESQTYATCRAL